MKKATLFFILTVLLLQVTYIHPVFAQEAIIPSITPTPSPVDYQLPYPGILPDNILYKLKAIRDRLVGFLISDPLKKADFDLLQADKRFSAGLSLKALHPQGNDLIIDTLSKGENYFSEGVTQLSLAKKQGENIGEINGKFMVSNRKHQEVVRSMEMNGSSQFISQLKNIEQRVAQQRILLKENESK